MLVWSQSTMIGETKMRYVFVATVAVAGLAFLAKVHPLMAMIVAVVGLVIGFDGTAIYDFLIS